MYAEAHNLVSPKVILRTPCIGLVRGRRRRGVRAKKVGLNCGLVIKAVIASPLAAIITAVVLVSKRHAKGYRSCTKGLHVTNRQ